MSHRMMKGKGEGEREWVSEWGDKLALYLPKAEETFYMPFSLSME